MQLRCGPLGPRGLRLSASPLIPIIAIPTAASAKPDKGPPERAKGDDAAITVTITCDPDLVTITSDSLALSNRVLVTASGEVRIEFEEPGPAETTIDPADYDDLTGIYVKAGSNSTKGNKGKGDYHPIDVGSICA